MGNRGFTLFELLVVVAIIGILTTIGVVSYASAQVRGRDSRRRADLKAIQSGIEQYYAENNGYPGGSYTLYTMPTTFFPSGAPHDPKDATEEYIVVTWTTTSYRVCADLESVPPHDYLQQDVCVTSLQ